MEYNNKRYFNEFYFFILFLMSITFLINQLYYVELEIYSKLNFISAIYYFLMPLLILTIYFILLYFITKITLHLTFIIYFYTNIIALFIKDRHYDILLVYFVAILIMYFKNLFNDIRYSAEHIRKAFKLFYIFFKYNIINILIWNMINGIFLFFIIMQKNPFTNQINLLFNFFWINFLMSYCINIYNSTLIWFYNINGEIKIKEALKNVFYALGSSAMSGFFFYIYLFFLCFVGSIVYENLWKFLFIFLYIDLLYLKIFISYLKGWSYIYIAVEGINCHDATNRMVEYFHNEEYLCKKINSCITFAYICFAISIAICFSIISSLNNIKWYLLAFSGFFSFPFFSIINGLYKIHCVYENNDN